MESRRIQGERLRPSPQPVLRAASTAAALAAPLLLAGCGMPGAPLPPSLNLPDRVTDLSAVRTGNDVALTWTMPGKNTDKTLLKGNIQVRVCRNQNASEGCTVASTLQLAPGADGAFADALPAALATGVPHPLTYFVELDNRKGRTAGLSNGAEVLAGEAPSAIAGLSAEMRRDGILLHWTPAPPDSAPTAVRLVRTLLTPPAKKPGLRGPLAPPAEPLQQNLLVDAAAHTDRTLDTGIRFGETYEYRAQRVARITVSGQTLELAGPLSAPLRIEAINTFPPAVPRGLAAVATAGENGAAPAIDLNWQPNTEPDLAGYIVYRRELGIPNERSLPLGTPAASGETSPSANATWQRISPAQPLVGPSYQDANVLPGRTYAYAVTAIDQDGHESARSAEAEETVPVP